MNFDIKFTPFFDCDEVQKMFGFEWDNLIDADAAENDSYIAIKCDDATLEDLYEDAEWFKNKFEDARLEHTNCQIKVVEYLRSVGYRSDVLMYVHY